MELGVLLNRPGSGAPWAVSMADMVESRGRVIG